VAFEINEPIEPADEQPGYGEPGWGADEFHSGQFVTEGQIAGGEPVRFVDDFHLGHDETYRYLSPEELLYDEEVDVGLADETQPEDTIHAELKRELNDTVRQAVAAHTPEPTTDNTEEFATYEQPVAEADIPARTREALDAIPLHDQATVVSYALRLDASTINSPHVPQTTASILRREDIPTEGKLRTWQVYTRTFDYGEDGVVCFRDAEGFERPYPTDTEEAAPPNDLGEPLPSEERKWPVTEADMQPSAEEIEALRKLFPGKPEAELYPDDIRGLQDTIVEAITPFAGEAVTTEDYDQIVEMPIPESAVPDDARDLLGSIPLHPDTQVVSYAARLLTGSGEDPGELEAAVHFVRHEVDPLAGITREWGVWYQTIYTGDQTNLYVCRRSVAGFERHHEDMAAGGPLDYEAGVAPQNPLPEWASQTPTREELDRLRLAFA
jgi:hypothetical protein